jgi:O-antigen/teichoic acid export membrane protein
MRILGIIGQVALVKLYTRYLLPAQLGQYFFFQAASYFLNALIFVPVDYFQQAEVFKLKKAGHSLSGLLTMNRRMLGAISAFSMLVCAVLLFARASILRAFCATVILAAALYISTAVKNFLNNQDDQIVAVIMVVAEVVLRLLFFFGIEKIGLMGPLAPLVAMAAGFLVVALIASPRVRIHIMRFPGSAKNVAFKTVFKFASPISLSAILNWLQLQAYSLVMIPLGFAEALGLFGTVYNIGNNGMNGATAVYQQIYQPRIYQTHGAYLWKYIRGAILTTLFVLAVGLGLRLQIVKLVTNGRFINYAWIIGFGILVEAGNLIISGLVVKLTIDGYTFAQIKANVIAVASVPACFALLYFTHRLNAFTIGVPLVLAQVIVICILVVQAESRRKQSLRSIEPPVPMPYETSDASQA